MKRTLTVLALAAALALVLTSASAHAPEAGTAAKTWTMLQSNPSGATILIDGKHHGKTPKKISWDTKKPPTVKLEKAGGWSAIAKLRDKDAKQTRTVKLKRAVDTDLPF